MINLDKNKYWVWFSLIENLGSRKKQELLKKYNNPQRIYDLKKEDIVKIPGFSEKKAEVILDKKKRYELNDYLQKMKKENVDIITIEDDEYPRILKNIYDYPISLYIKGNKKILNNKSIGIVGCRIASEYGIKAAQYFA